MATLSVVLIVKNEAANLAACLDTVSWADEIVVVDAGSSDNTIEIAQRYTSKVHVESDWPGYGIQRQRAQCYATGDWILMLDADERVTPELRASIEQVVASDDRKAVYAVPRLSWCFGRFIRHGGWYPDRVVRLYPREHASYGEERVHEKLHFGSLEERRISGDLLHFTYRDLHHYLVKSAGYARDWSMQRHARNKKASLLEGAWHGLGCFLRMYLLRAGFLDGRAGLLLALLSAHSTFVKYADLWLRDQPSAPDNAS